MDYVEQNLIYSGKSFRDPQVLVDKAECQANHKEVLEYLSVSTPKVCQALGLKLDVVGVSMLQD